MDLKRSKIIEKAIQLQRQKSRGDAYNGNLQRKNITAITLPNVGSFDLVTSTIWALGFWFFPHFVIQRFSFISFVPLMILNYVSGTWFVSVICLKCTFWVVNLSNEFGLLLYFKIFPISLQIGYVQIDNT